MRRHAAREGLVAPFAHYYGVLPWQLDDLTMDEYRQMREALPSGKG